MSPDHITLEAWRTAALMMERARDDLFAEVERLRLEVDVLRTAMRSCDREWADNYLDKIRGTSDEEHTS